MSITLEQKLKALREVENIYALSKKWQRSVPDEKRPNWERIADNVLRRALGKPITEPRERVSVRASTRHHEQDPRTARVVERTLRNGLVHPDVLHSYSSGVVRDDVPAPRARRALPRADTPSVRHLVQHGATDLHYPSGHMQGLGFVPRQHEAAKHVQLESAGPAQEASVPTTASVHYS